MLIDKRIVDQRRENSPMKTKEESLLGQYRVLDMSEGGCLICGKILGDLGADVIKIEKPGGSPSRSIGPFYNDNPDPQKSLFWFAYNTNKRSITLDIETSNGKEIFKRLSKTADFVIESFPPGYMKRLCIDYSVLSEMNPSIILTSITPFGQEGPKANYESSDLTTWAAGGALYITGYPDRPPNWIGPHQASFNAGSQAAYGTMIANWHRKRTGEGQHVDVSVQESVTQTLHHTALYWDVYQTEFKRQGFSMRGGKTWMKLGFPCKDGYIALLLMGGGGAAMVKSSNALVNWMAEEGVASEWLMKINWEKDYDASKLSQETVDRVENEVSSFLMRKTKLELFEEGIRRRILIAPVNNAKDLVENIQLRERNFWVEVKHPELNDILTYCGNFAKISEAPIKIRRRPPLIGEHNEEVYYEEMGIGKKKLYALKKAGVI